MGSKLLKSRIFENKKKNGDKGIGAINFKAFRGYLCVHPYVYDSTQ